MPQPAVYIMASARNGTLYTGVTKRADLYEGFARAAGSRSGGLILPPFWIASLRSQ
jgi:hypothetical protein